MRLLVLGFLGPYPERMSTFVGDGHQIWYVATLPLAPESLPGVCARYYWDLAKEHAAGGIAALLDLIKSQQIDAVYSLLNVWDGSAAITAELLTAGCPVPLVRHYKEHYMAPREDERLSIELATGAIFINSESCDYFASHYKLPAHIATLDADLLPRRYLYNKLKPKLSSLDPDGQPHLLIAGTVTDDSGRYDYRDLITQLVATGAYVHLYGLFKRMYPNGYLLPDDAVAIVYRDLGCGNKLLIHNPIAPDQFVEQWSQYDAGLLHAPRHDDAFRVLNMPNRYSAYIAAGVPVALQGGAMPAMERHLKNLGATIVYQTPANLVERLPDQQIAARTLEIREQATFETVYPDLIRFIEACL